ncbi:MAG TPA: ABC transporter ATP-binding protein [Chloroflexi bacterium]|nr:ABC transporter ATP-binding protein [Chloroflexota bacterium]
MGDAIIMDGLGKQFPRYHPDRPRTVQEAVLRGLRRIRPVERFWALRDVSFRVAHGRMVGVVGFNGAGKSTLLRLIGGVGRPDEGRVEVHGRIGALLDLGAGLHPDLTGRENVFVSGVIAGLTRREVAQRFDSIVAFAELEQFIDSPLRTYSTGMQMRLAFAVAAHIEPELLLIDEVLAVGDAAFQRKCLDRIAQFKSMGCTILLVSHDTTLIRQLCDEALWLRSGQLVASGAADGVVGQYLASLSARTRRATPANENSSEALRLEIVAVHLLDEGGFPIAELESGQAMRVEIEYFARGPVPTPIFGVTVTRDDGLICYDTSTAAAGLALTLVQGTGRIALQFERLDLSGGRYYIDVGTYAHDWGDTYDYHWRAYPLTVRPTSGEKGVLSPPHCWEVGSVLAPRAKLLAPAARNGMPRE